MRLGIDASNLRVGGGLTHLVELVRAAQPAAHSIDVVTVWGGRATLAQLPADRAWLQRRHDPMLDRPLPVRLFWRRARLPRLARSACDLLFAPGGVGGGSFEPFVTMSRNMLPFEPAEARRYGVGGMRLKLPAPPPPPPPPLPPAPGPPLLHHHPRPPATPPPPPLPPPPAAAHHRLHAR